MDTYVDSGINKNHQLLEEINESYGHTDSTIFVKVIKERNDLFAYVVNKRIQIKILRVVKKLILVHCEKW